MATVDIYLSSDDVVPAPIAGALVSVLDPANSFVVAGSAVSDAVGKAGFSLPLGTYEVRIYKLGVVFGNPCRMIVDADGRFEVIGAVQTLPAATDPRLCRCSGRFVSFSNQPMVGVTVIVNAQGETGMQVPKVVDGQMVVSSARYFKTNANGFITADLFRGGEYYLTFSGDDDRMWNFKVPDRASANLIDLIHPQPVSLTWGAPAVSNAVEMAVGDVVNVPMSLLFSDFQTYQEGLSRWLQLSSSDTNVVTVQLAQDKASLVAVLPGSTQVLAELLKGIFPVRVPDYQLAAPPLVVTVT